MSRNGTKIEQLDIDTEEPIEVYNSICSAAEDNYIAHSVLNNALKSGNGVARLSKKQLLFKRVEG